MSLIGNILWIIFCGWWLGLSWLVFGVLWCITIIGIPVGLQCFKLCVMGFMPFGKTISRENVGLGKMLLNVIWIIFSGFWLAIGYLIAGVLCSITIIGIPFGLQCFKLASLAFSPFGAKVVYKKVAGKRKK